jgi:hypothetical protein
MTFANAVKILTLVAMLATSIMSVVGGLIPADIAVVVNALIAAVLAFTEKIGKQIPEK